MKSSIALPLMSLRGRKIITSGTSKREDFMLRTRTAPISWSRLRYRSGGCLSWRRLGKKPRSVNYLGPITAHNKGPATPLLAAASVLSLVQPDGMARDENARGEGGVFVFT